MKAASSSWIGDVGNLIRPYRMFRLKTPGTWGPGGTLEARVDGQSAEHFLMGKEGDTKPPAIKLVGNSFAGVARILAEGYEEMDLAEVMLKLCTLRAHPVALKARQRDRIRKAVTRHCPDVRVEVAPRGWLRASGNGTHEEILRVIAIHLAADGVEFDIAIFGSRTELNDVYRTAPIAPDVWPLAVSLGVIEATHRTSTAATLPYARALF